MRTSKFLILFLLIILAFPSLIVAYGEGTTQGAVKSGIDSGKICRCETLEEVRQGYKWSTRPEAMKKSPYEAVSSFWLLDPVKGCLYIHRGGGCEPECSTGGGDFTSFLFSEYSQCRLMTTGRPQRLSDV